MNTRRTAAAGVAHEEIGMPNQKWGWALSPDVHRRMTDMIFGYWVSQTIRAFVDLSIADHLADGPLTTDELAERERSAPQTTFRLVRAGISLGLVTVDATERVHSTALLDTLRKDAARSLRGLALGLTNRSHWLPWGEFVAAVRDGCSHSYDALGMDLYAYLQGDPSIAEEFTGAMEAATALCAHDVVGGISTSDVAMAVDVGGSSGALLRQLQRANPGLRGIIFNCPDVADEVAAKVEQSDCAGCIQVVGGDFFDSLPVADLYLLKFILHDWDDESCVEILKRCREAMTTGGRIAIIEMLIGDQGDPGVVALMDLNMLAVTGGRERSLGEYDALLFAAGLRRIAVWSADSSQSVIEAVAV
jgi:hypothetical protein